MRKKRSLESHERYSHVRFPWGQGTGWRLLPAPGPFYTETSKIEYLSAAGARRRRGYLGQGNASWSPGCGEWCRRHQVTHVTRSRSAGLPPTPLGSLGQKVRRRYPVGFPVAGASGAVLSSGYGGTCKCGDRLRRRGFKPGEDGLGRGHLAAAPSRPEMGAPGGVRGLPGGF